MKLKLPQYNGKDNMVMLAIVPVFAFCFNLANFNPSYFSDAPHFAAYTLVSIILFGGYFILCGAIAVYLRNRFPEERQLFRRLSVSIIAFLLTTGLFLRGALQFYESIPWFGYSFSPKVFLWNYVALGIINIFLVFFMEGISRYQDWKKSLAETEALKITYQQGRLNALKSQVNPHFLFNCLNTLSSLIQENEEQADRFLNEMTRVYRYLLRPDTEHLVELETELQFIQSYTSLLHTRYGEALVIRTGLDENNRSGKLPPLSLQVVIENIITENTLSRTQPLQIEISTENSQYAFIRHNVQLKQAGGRAGGSSGMNNLVQKYELLGNPLIITVDEFGFRTIGLPILPEKEVPL
jgi:two-component system, LytTR family, sensor kinase